MGSSGALNKVLYNACRCCHQQRFDFDCEKKDVTGRSRGTKSNSLAVLRTKFFFKLETSCPSIVKPSPSSLTFYSVSLAKPILAAPSGFGNGQSVLRFNSSSLFHTWLGFMCSCFSNSKIGFSASNARV